MGDGEAETGPMATSWHGIKVIEVCANVEIILFVWQFLDPKTCGAVLPILHLNGYKISSPTIFGSMSNEDITSYFTGLGYQVIIW